jgi:hypothetical protein
MSNQKQDWIWLMALVIKYEQIHNDNKGIEFWNWAIEYYQPEEFDQIEIE